MKNSKSGFSLVELMVVVSIIAILASIAVPNFSKMSARAKQTAARIELSGVYTAEQAFFTEYSTYHPNLPYIGYIPDGWELSTTDSCPLKQISAAKNTRYYTVGFAPGAGSGISMAFDVAPQGAPTEPNTTKATCASGGGIGTEFYPGTVPGSDTTGGNLSISSIPKNNEFTAAAVGRVTSSGTRDDKWTINQTKNISNVQSGI